MSEYEIDLDSDADSYFEGEDDFYRDMFVVCESSIPRQEPLMNVSSLNNIEIGQELIKTWFTKEQTFIKTWYSDMPFIYGVCAADTKLLYEMSFPELILLRLFYRNRHSREGLLITPGFCITPQTCQYIAMPPFMYNEIMGKALQFNNVPFDGALLTLLSLNFILKTNISELQDRETVFVARNSAIRCFSQWRSDKNVQAESLKPLFRSIRSTLKDQFTNWLLKCFLGIF